MTRIEDAETAVAAGADAVGFVFVPGTPRAVTSRDVATLLAAIPAGVTKVGLFVNATAETIHAVLDETGLDTVQLHGEETPEFAGGLRARVQVWKAFRIRDAAGLDAVPGYFSVSDAVLLDAYVPGAHGGTGAQFDWSLADRIRKLSHRVVIAGGLRPENVADAVERFAPWAVDVSSGVESAPGRKDPAKVRAFIHAAKAVPLAG